MTQHYSSQQIALYSLFHHDIYSSFEQLNFNTRGFLSFTKKNQLIESNDIADILYSIIIETINGYNDNEITLTLTGGMDSRLILACLLKAGVKPNCLTFGNPETHDVIFAKNLAEKLALPFHNACQEPPTKDWYFKWVVETIKRDQGTAHLHRAHRTAAIAEHAEIYHPKVLLTGHMGGEGLRGLTYNNYFASSFFEWVNEGKYNPLDAAQIMLKEYFIKLDNIDYEKLIKRVQNLSWMKHDKETNKFYFLYDLVAKIHHAQDIRLYQSYVPKVVPVYLQSKYLEALFSSPFNFLSKGNNLLTRLKNPEFYCKVIKEIYPPLMDLPFANGFTPREYLRGLWYYIPVKMFRDYKKKKKYPPTFSYDKWYVDFVKEHSQNISPEIWKIYDKMRYMNALENNNHQTNEGYWHKFSNPIYFDLLNKFHDGKL